VLFHHKQHQGYPQKKAEQLPLSETNEIPEAENPYDEYQLYDTLRVYQLDTSA
jgi:hypothetical protein